MKRISFKVTFMIDEEQLRINPVQVIKQWLAETIVRKIKSEVSPNPLKNTKVTVMK